MPCKKSSLAKSGFIIKSHSFYALVMVLLLLPATGVSAQSIQNEEFVMVGDIMLSRNVAKGIADINQNPWVNIKDIFKPSTYVIGNFEGAIGRQKDCVGKSEKTICFAVANDNAALMKEAGIRAVSVENNHILDLGKPGKTNTTDNLEKLGLDALSFEKAPWFIKVKDKVIAIVPYNVVGIPDFSVGEIPNLELSQKIRLAHQLSDLTIIYIHWGNELQDWPSDLQKKQASWLMSEGADMIVGSHPHVMQGFECMDGKPVIYSLGNHLFDQKYPATKTGQMLRCTPGQKDLSCQFSKTSADPKTFFPDNIVPDNDANKFWENCKAKFHEPTAFKATKFYPVISERAIPVSGMKIKIASHLMPAPNLITLQTAMLKPKEKFLLALQNNFSSIDKVYGMRPYVYDLGPHGLIAKWRGSALAWPLLDITTVRENDTDYLCALHRGDSFLKPDPTTKETRTQLYQWNGFGFSAYNNPALNKKCNEYYSTY
jgi:hypothetical protein